MLCIFSSECDPQENPDMSEFCLVSEEHDTFFQRCFQNLCHEISERYKVYRDLEHFLSNLLRLTPFDLVRQRAYNPDLLVLQSQKNYQTALIKAIKVDRHDLVEWLTDEENLMLSEHDLKRAAHLAQQWGKEDVLQYFSAHAVVPDEFREAIGTFLPYGETGRHFLCREEGDIGSFDWNAIQFGFYTGPNKEITVEPLHISGVMQKEHYLTIREGLLQAVRDNETFYDHKPITYYPKGNRPILDDVAQYGRLSMRALFKK